MFVVANDDHRLRVAGLVVNAAVIVVWLWSRTVGLPIGPEAGVPEDADAADVVATLFEVLILVWTTLSLVRIEPSREPAPGVIVASNVLVWSFVVLLTTSVFLLDSDDGGELHSWERSSRMSSSGTTYMMPPFSGAP